MIKSLKRRFGSGPKKNPYKCNPTVVIKEYDSRVACVRAYGYGKRKGENCRHFRKYKGPDRGSLSGSYKWRVKISLVILNVRFEDFSSLILFFIFFISTPMHTNTYYSRVLFLFISYVRPTHRNVRFYHLWYVCVPKELGNNICPLPP